MGFTSLGNILAPSLGPILGGALSESRFGWRGIFWFLALSGGVVLLGLVGWFPETKADATRQRAEAIAEEEEQEGGAGGKKRRHILTFPNPFSSLRMLFHLPTGLIILSNGLVFASYYAVTAGIPTQFKRIYGLSDMGIGLVFIPAGLGSLLSAVFNGVVVDWNYRRKANQFIQRVTNMSDNSDTDTNMQEFPIERARLQIGAPMIVLSSSLNHCVLYIHPSDGNR
jgi:MFS family permease